MKSMLSTSLLVVSIAARLGCMAQPSQTNEDLSARLTLFAEAGGSAPLASVGLDYLIAPPSQSVKYSLALAITHHFQELGDFVFAPQFNLLFGQRWMVELGGGPTLPIAEADNWVIIPRLGIRHQKARGGLMLRFGFTPVVKLQGNHAFLPGFGFGAGYTLKQQTREE